VGFRKWLRLPLGARAAAQRRGCALCVLLHRAAAIGEDGGPAAWTGRRAPWCCRPPHPSSATWVAHVTSTQAGNTVLNGLPMLPARPHLLCVDETRWHASVAGSFVTHHPCHSSWTRRFWMLAKCAPCCRLHGARSCSQGSRARERCRLRSPARPSRPVLSCPVWRKQATEWCARAPPARSCGCLGLKARQNAALLGCCQVVHYVTSFFSLGDHPANKLV